MKYIYGKRIKTLKDRVTTLVASLAILANSAGVALPVLLTQKVAAAPSTTVTPSSPSGWAENNVRGDGASSISSDRPDAHGGNGSLKQSFSNGTGKTDYRKLGNYGSVDALTALSFEWYRDSTSTAPAHFTPAVGLYVDDGAGNSWLLKWEGVYNGYPSNGPAAPTDTWIQENLLESSFWRIPQYVNGSWVGFDGCNQSGDPYQCYVFNRKLNDTWLNGFNVVGLEAGIGSGWSGSFTSYVDYITINNSVYDFEIVPSAPVCNYDFQAEKMWEINWGTNLENRNDPWAFNTKSNGGLLKINGASLPSYITNHDAAKPSEPWHWLYVSDTGDYNPKRYDYDFADGSRWTAEVTFSEVNGCHVPNIAWNNLSNVAPDLTVVTPAEGSTVSTKVNNGADRLRITGSFTDNIKANYATMQLVKNGSSVAIGTLYGYGPVYNPAATYANADGTYTYDLPVPEGLADGEYSLFYVGTDFTGGVTERMERKFFIDNTDPTFEIISPANGSTVSGTVTIEARITDDSDITKVLMNIGGISRSWTNGSSSTITRTGDIFSTTIDTSLLPDGPVWVTLRGTDGVGNTRYWNNNANHRQHVFYVDNTAPDAPVVSLKESPSGDIILNGGLTNSYGVVASWTTGPDDATYQYRYYNSIPSDSYNAPNYYVIQPASNSVNGVFNRGEGLHHIQVRVADAAGNWSDWSQVFNVTYDASAPEVTNVILNGNTVNVARSVNCGPTEFNPASGTINLSATITDNLSGVHSAKYKIRKVTDGGCTQTNIYQSGTVTMNNQGGDSWVTLPGSELDTTALPADGNYTIMITVVDNAGNSATKYVDITVENAPTLTADYFTVHSDHIAVGFSVDKFDDATAVEVAVYDASNNLITTNTGISTDMLNLLNSTTGQISSPFYIPFQVASDGYWQFGNADWASKVPAYARVTVTYGSGEQLVDEVDFVPANVDIPSQTYAALIAALPPAGGGGGNGGEGLDEEDEGTVAGANTGTPSNNDRSNPGRNAATRGGQNNLALATEAGENPEETPADARVLQATDTANDSDTSGEDETEENNGCGKFLGLCWYLWIPIVIAILGTVYYVSSRRADEK